VKSIYSFNDFIGLELPQKDVNACYHFVQNHLSGRILSKNFT